MQRIIQFAFSKCCFVWGKRNFIVSIKLSDLHPIGLYTVVYHYNIIVGSVHFLLT